MSRNLISDGWHRIAPDCLITVDLHRTDGNAEVIIGDRLGHDDAVTLVLADPDTCNRLIEAATAARDFLTDLRADADTRTATSESSPLALLPSL